jgi:hypothetical protein
MFIQEIIDSLTDKKQALTTRNLLDVSHLSADEIRTIAITLSYDSAITELRRQAGKKFIFHVASPKSGSTGIAQSVGPFLRTRGWKTPSMTVGGGNRAQDFFLSELIRLEALEHDIFTDHQHCVFSSYILELLTAINAKVVFQTRNLYDMLISLRDHLDNETTVKPMFYIDRNQWAALKQSEKLDFLIYNVAPWYINFWVGWSHAQKAMGENFLVVRYEDLLQRPDDIFESILDFSELPRSAFPTSTDSIYTKNVFTRKNKAIIGRGELFTTEHRRHVDMLCKPYTDIDFSAMGID